MSFKHSVSCGRCGVETLAVDSSEGWRPPRGWLSISYSVVSDKGTYTVFENRHACSDCAQGVVDALGKATSPTEK
jgi:ribosomal protein S27AE